MALARRGRTRLFSRQILPEVCAYFRAS